MVVGDALGLAGGQPLVGGQHPHIQPVFVQSSEGGQLLGPGGQQDISPLVRQKFRRCLTAGNSDRTLDLTGRPQETEQRYPCPLTGRSDFGGGKPCIGVGGVHAQVEAREQHLHPGPVQPPRQNPNILQPVQLLRPQLRGHADGDLRPQFPGLLSQNASFSGAAENQKPHSRYPLLLPLPPASPK